VNGASERARTLTAAGDRVPVESELGDASERREHASQLWFGDVGRQLSDEQLTSTPSCVQPRRCRRRRQPTATPAAAAAAATYTTGARTGRKTVPIQFVQCWFPGLAIFSVLKYEYIFQIFNNKKYTKAILSNSTRKLLRFGVSKTLTAVLKI